MGSCGFVWGFALGYFAGSLAAFCGGVLDTFTFVSLLWCYFWFLSLTTMVKMSFTSFIACLSFLLIWTSFVVRIAIIRFLTTVVTSFSCIVLGTVINLWWR